PAWRNRRTDGDDPARDRPREAGERVVSEGAAAGPLQFLPRLGGPSGLDQRPGAEEVLPGEHASVLLARRGEEWRVRAPDPAQHGDARARGRQGIGAGPTRAGGA